MNNPNYRKYYASILFLSFLGAISCVSVKPIYFEDDKKVAERHVEKFHQSFNEEKFDGMFELFTPKGRNESSRETFARDLKSLRSRFGRIKNSKLVKSEVKPQASTRLVHMFFETEFDNGKLIEEFDCLVNGDNAIFDHYGQPDAIPNK